jgi:hypothetical protein
MNQARNRLAAGADPAGKSQGGDRFTALQLWCRGKQKMSSGAKINTY